MTKKEPLFLNGWEKLYYKALKDRQDREKYILHDGPPYANGKIHIGHTLNKILKDMVVKYKLQRGYCVPFVPGWDCHGLPVELKLLEKLKARKDEVDQIEFRKKAKDFALNFVGVQKKDFIRLGGWADWKNPYLTLKPDYEYGVLNVLKELADAGYVYRGLKPVNWCIDCATALAEAEVEYQDKESDSIYVKFKLTDKVFEDVDEDVNIMIWTTTPWTLLSNSGVALHPDLDYVLVRTSKGVFVFAESLKPLIEEKVFQGKVEVLQKFNGGKLKGHKAFHPFFDRDSEIVLADYVSAEEGSGCVHIAPGHGEEDYKVGKEYGLPTIMPVDNKGYFKDVGEFSGLRVNKVNSTVIDTLKSNDKLLLAEKISHSYPHCWRCKKPLIFRTTDQWFLDMEHRNLRDRLCKTIENVGWIPSQGKERMYSMVKTRPDWCLSRQRLWGIPIPAVRCKDCGKVLLDVGVIKNFAEKVKEKSSDVWFKEEVNEFLPEGFKCECGSTSFEKEKDILDVWFESGASFNSVLKTNPQLGFPSDLYLEGSDQHRGWFQVSLILSVALTDNPPFKNVLTHGFVVDGEGKKMSKSQGNVIPPQKVMNKFGAEVLRLWVSFGNYAGDVGLSDDIIKQLVDSYRKIRNTIRFVLANISDFNPQTELLSVDKLWEVDKYMLSVASVFLSEIEGLYDRFLFYKVYQKLYEFCNVKMSSFYLDITKDRLYTFPRQSEARKSAQTVLWYIQNFLLKAMAPILSFTAEEAYSYFSAAEEKESVFLSEWPDYKSFKSPALLEKWEKIFSIREQVLKGLEEKRAKSELGSSLEAEVVLNFSNPEDYKLFKEAEDVLREVFIVSGVYVKEKDKFSIEIKKSEGNKCPRCWNYRYDLGEDDKFSEVCSRCAKALKEIDADLNTGR